MKALLESLSYRYIFGMGECSARAECLMCFERGDGQKTGPSYQLSDASQLRTRRSNEPHLAANDLDTVDEDNRTFGEQRFHVAR